MWAQRLVKRWSHRIVRRIFVIWKELFDCFGLGSASVVWYKDSKTISFGCLLVDVFPRTDDPSRYLKKQKNLFDVLSIWSVEIFETFWQGVHEIFQFSKLSNNCKVHFPRISPEDFICYLCEFMVNLLNVNLQELKESNFWEIENKLTHFFLVKINLKETRRILSSRKDLLLKQTIYTFVKIHLSGHGAVCSPTFYIDNRDNK